jgi:hypothetical protein
MKKVLIIAVLFAVLGGAFFMQPTEGKTKPYYSGKSADYNGTFYVGTVNTGDFELFALNNGQLNKVTDIQSNDGGSPVFTDLLFSESDGNFYVYLVNGKYLYKYDITNPLTPTVLLKIKDNSQNWTSRLEMVNGNLATIGNKGMNIWNKDMKVVNSYSMINDKNIGSANFAENGKFIANLNSSLKVYDTASRQKVSDYSIASNDASAVRSFTSDDNLIYLVDDQSLKAVTSNGEVVKQYDHAGNSGYDVINSTDPNYLYFSDGMGVVKMDKESFKSVKWNWTIRTSPAGSWAMGLTSANDENGEKIAVFNGNEILVLDSNMNKIAEYVAVEQDSRPIQSLSLLLDKNFAASGSQLSVRGAGYGVNETVKIQINKIFVAEVQTDDLGEFSTIVTIPAIKAPLNTEVKVTGESSGLTYSTTFRVE